LHTKDILPKLDNGYMPS